MLYPVLFLFILVGVAISDEEDDCEENLWSKCNITNVPTKIPNSMAKLKEDCKVVQDAIKCPQEEYSKCKRTSLISMQMGKMAQFMEANCNEGSSLYQALSRHYECIQPVAENVTEQCRPFEDWEDMLNMINKVGELSEDAIGCADPLFEIICIGHMVGMQCGQEAKEAVTEILQNALWNFRDCNEESILRDLQPLKKVFETTLAEAD